MDPYKKLRSYGEALIESVDPARAEVAAVRALAAPSAGLPLRRRLVAIAAASATFITGNVGMAMAADSAAPGDLLYGLDRAYEQVSEIIGLGRDHSEERLAEAAQLASTGNSADALNAVIDQIHTLQSDHPVDASGLDTAVKAVTDARDREVGNETAETAGEQAKAIVGIAHQIAEAAQSGDRDLMRELIEDLKDAARQNGNSGENGNSDDNGNSDENGDGQNNGQGPPDEPGNRGNGGDLGNSGQTPKP